MEDTNARHTLATALGALRQQVRGRLSDKNIAALATTILSRGESPADADPEHVVTGGVFNSWFQADPKLPGTVERLLAVVLAIHRVRDARDDLALSRAETRYWTELYWAAKGSPAPTGSEPAPSPEPAGTPLSEITNPFDLQVHEVITAEGPVELPPLTPYVRRAHDDKLAAVVNQALDGDSGVVMLLGDSSTGKTRALWETLEPLRAQGGWRLWHSLTSDREMLLAQLDQIGPRTVLWLNETQLYLQDTSTRERDDVAKELYTLVTDARRAPVLILGTMWREHYNALCGDPRSMPRRLFAPALIEVPSTFEGADLDALRQQARGDARLAEACARAEGGQITQYLAGGPELIHVYETAGEVERAVIDAVIDAVRLGHTNALPYMFLRDAASAYISDTRWAYLEHDWFDAALHATMQECKGARGPITPIRPRPDSTPTGWHRQKETDAAEVPALYQLADYLDQHGRRNRAFQIPPLGFWKAAAAHATGDQQNSLAHAAWDRGLYRTAAQLWKTATGQGDHDAARSLVDRMHEMFPGDPQPAHWAALQHLCRAPRQGGAAAGAVAGDRGRGTGAGTGRPRHPDTPRQPGRGGAAAGAVTGDRGRGTGAGTDRPRHPDTPQRPLRGRVAAGPVAGDRGRRTGAGTDRPRHPARGAVAAGAVAGDRGRGTGAGTDRPRHPDTPRQPARGGAAAEAVTGDRAEEQVQALLARDPATQVPLNNPGGVALLLKQLREIGAEEQVQALADRATPLGVVLLLEQLQEIGAEEQAQALADRATQIPLDNPDEVASLLKQLRELGVEEQLGRFLMRLPAAGGFHILRMEAPDPEVFRFGWDPRTRGPVEPWSWQDLE